VNSPLILIIRKNFSVFDSRLKIVLRVEWLTSVQVEFPLSSQALCVRAQHGAHFRALKTEQLEGFSHHTNQQLSPDIDDYD